MTSSGDKFRTFSQVTEVHKQFLFVKHDGTKVR